MNDKFEEFVQEMRKIDSGADILLEGGQYLNVYLPNTQSDPKILLSVIKIAKRYGYVPKKIGFPAQKESGNY